jgi:hypothetical protein
MIVEQEPTSAQISPSQATEASLQFFRLLKLNRVGQYQQAYLAQYPLPNPASNYQDRESDRYLRLTTGRTLNPIALYNALRASRPTLPAAPIIAAADQAAVKLATEVWLAWYGKRYGSPTTEAWIPERLEHAFAVATNNASDGTYLTNEYHGGHLDWYHFNHTSALQITLPTPGSSTSKDYVRTVIPSPVSFRGMPDARWWSFEDAKSNLGNLDAGPKDLGRMLLLQYALSYSDNWFLMPLDLDVGADLKLQSLVVTDTFGVRTLIKPFDQVDGATGTWQMFTHTQTNGNGATSGARIFRPPTLPSALHSQPIEEVHFLRDELANLAWAVEYKIENARGHACHRHETELTQSSPPAPSSSPAGAELTYQLMTQVPAHWIPLVPTLGDRQQLQFRRGRMLNVTSNTTAPSQGKILHQNRPLVIEHEEIERAGAHVTRAYQFSRWFNGQSYLWIARHKRIGRGEGWSGLQFDQTNP